MFAAQLGVGRPAVREALRALEAVGAIETRKGVGRFVGCFAAESYVRNFTTESLLQSFNQRELTETRCLLEISAIPQAVARLTDADLDEIRTLLEEMRLRVAGGEPYTAEDLGMHRVIMRHVDNRLIAAMLDAVYALAVARTARPKGSARDRSAGRPGGARRPGGGRAARDGLLAQQRLMAHFDRPRVAWAFAPSWRALQGNQATGENPHPQRLPSPPCPPSCLRRGEGDRPWQFGEGDGGRHVSVSVSHHPEFV